MIRAIIGAQNAKEEIESFTYEQSPVLYGYAIENSDNNRRQTGNRTTKIIR